MDTSKPPSSCALEGSRWVLCPTCEDLLAAHPAKRACSSAESTEAEGEGNGGPGRREGEEKERHRAEALRGARVVAKSLARHSDLFITADGKLLNERCIYCWGLLTAHNFLVPCVDTIDNDGTGDDNDGTGDNTSSSLANGPREPAYKTFTKVSSLSDALARLAQSNPFRQFHEVPKVCVALPPDLREFQRAVTAEPVSSALLAAMNRRRTEGAHLPLISTYIRDLYTTIAKNAHTQMSSPSTESSSQGFPPHLLAEAHEPMTEVLLKVDIVDNVQAELLLANASLRNGSEPPHKIRRPNNSIRAKGRRGKGGSGSAIVLPAIEDQCIVLEAVFSAGPICYAGRYVKNSRVVCQSPWTVGGRDRENEGGDCMQTGSKPVASVEELLAETVGRFHDTRDVSLVGAGREDLDVRMLGTGRDFLFVLRNSRVLEPFLPTPISKETTKETAVDRVEESDVGLGHGVLCGLGSGYHVESRVPGVYFRDVRLAAVGHGSVARALKTAHEDWGRKNKLYAFTFSLTASFAGADPERVSALKIDEAFNGWIQGEDKLPLKVSQLSPVRVFHRRAALLRQKEIYELEIKRVSEAIYCGKIMASAGTYIKEFVHGDLGRTKPSLASCIMEALQSASELTSKGSPLPSDIACHMLQLDVLQLRYHEASSAALHDGLEEDG